MVIKSNLIVRLLVMLVFVKVCVKVFVKGGIGVAGDPPPTTSVQLD